VFNILKSIFCMNSLTVNEFFCKNFKEADEKKQLHPNNWMKFIHLPNGKRIALGSYQPPFGINLCTQMHIGYCLQGKMSVMMNEQQSQKKLYSEGDFFYIPRDHISEVEGEELCTTLYCMDFYTDKDLENLELFQKNALKQPDEHREMPKFTLDIVKFTDKISMSLSTFEPGWKWSKDMQPLSKTDSCMHSHIGYIIQGELRVVMDSKEYSLKEGDVYCIPKGHDAYVEGNKPCKTVNFYGSSLLHQGQGRATK